MISIFTSPCWNGLVCLATLIFHVHSGDHPGIIGFYWTGEAQKYSIINPMELLIQRAASYAGSVVLPEGQDPRVMNAPRIRPCRRAGLAVGSPAGVRGGGDDSRGD
jgi:hypothetical protein